MHQLNPDISTTDGPSLIKLFLDQQQQPTVVEKFAQRHSDQPLPLQQRHYRDLIPLSAPEAGQQYAFEVDMDACSGCKACVTACHNLNGLEEEELWRNVGLLHGGTSEEPVLQHVTTTCHHCIEPACLSGCPAVAYEKDPLTGIVRHLDDQCIGCQYCMLTCPYDVPRYSQSKGIVRKCDMCQDRLAGAEAPACVQACPSKAIRIQIVDRHSIVEQSETNQFLPGAADPGKTLPTTIYKTQRSLPRNLLPADYYSARPQHGHPPLVFMLVLTQMSVGTFIVKQLLSNPFVTSTVTEMPESVRAIHLIAAWLVGLLGLGASVLHLGRPQFAYRALWGLRTSWLSREILAFGVFAAAASLYVGAACLSRFSNSGWLSLEQPLGTLAGLSGVVAISCSVMVYVATGRPFWNGPLTSAKFFLTAMVLGIPVALLISLAASWWSNSITVEQILTQFGTSLYCWLIVGMISKLAIESSIFVHLRHHQHTPLKRTALLMTGEFSHVTMQRFFCGVMGGVLLPLVMIYQQELAPSGFSYLFVAFFNMLIFALLVSGELMERHMFFTTVVAPKMPGAPVT